jgi:lipoic acid synthetase
MGLKYAVITSVTRDDLPDGGASQFVDTILAIRKASPGTKIEVLIPDFGGSATALASVIQAGPEVLNHNLEVPESIYTKINRPVENYDRSLKVLRNAEELGAITKSGLMIGLGESEEEIIRTLEDLIKSGCMLLTIGQYLQPRRRNVRVEKFYSPADFARLKARALEMGFTAVESGPLVRSSYHAHELYGNLRKDQVSVS